MHCRAGIAFNMRYKLPFEQLPQTIECHLVSERQGVKKCGFPTPVVQKVLLGSTSSKLNISDCR